MSNDAKKALVAALAFAGVGVTVYISSGTEVVSGQLLPDGGVELNDAGSIVGPILRYCAASNTFVDPAGDCPP